jgi:hypothetical protein
MEVNQEPDGDSRSVRKDGSLFVLGLLAFAVGGTSGLIGAVFRVVLDRSDRFRGAVIDWAHGKEIAGFALVIWSFDHRRAGLAAWLVRKFAPGAKSACNKTLVCVAGFPFLALGFYQNPYWCPFSFCFLTSVVKSRANSMKNRPARFTIEATRSVICWPRCCSSPLRVF